MLTNSLVTMYNSKSESVALGVCCVVFPRCYRSIYTLAPSPHPAPSDAHLKADMPNAPYALQIRDEYFKFFKGVGGGEIKTGSYQGMYRAARETKMYFSSLLRDTASSLSLTA